MPRNLVRLIAFALLLSPGCNNSGSGNTSSDGSSGAALFAKTFGGAGADAFGDVEETPDGGYIAVGSYGGRPTMRPSGLAGPAEEDDLFLVKMNGLGDEEWSRSLSHGAPSSFASPVSLQEPYAAFPTSGGGFFVLGSVRDQPSGNPEEYAQDVSITRLTSSGDTAWESVLDIPPPLGWTIGGASLGGEDYPIAAAEAPDGGAYVVGFTYALFDTNGGLYGSAFSWMLRVDVDGRALWSRPLTESPSQSLVVDGSYLHVVVAGDGDAYAVYSARGAGGQIWTQALCFAPTGTIRWERRVDDVFTRHADLALGSPVDGDDGLVLACDQVGSNLEVTGSRGIAIDPDGSIEFNVDLDLAHVDLGLGRMDTPATGASYHFFGLAERGDAELTVRPRDVTGAPMVGTGGSFATVHRARAARLDRFAVPGRIEVLAQRVDPVGNAEFEPAVTLAGNADAPFGAPFDTSSELAFSLPARDDMVIASRVAGFVPDSSRTWSWVAEPGTGNASYRLTAYRDDGTMDWSRTFSADAANRVEQGLDIELLVNPAQPDAWRVAALGRADVDVDVTPGEEADVPWLVILDPQANVLVDVAYAFAGLPAGTGPGLLDSAPNGDLFIGILADGAPRVLRVDQQGTVLWCSTPVASIPQGIEQFGLAALQDGGVLVSCNDVVARFDSTGTATWRTRLFARTVVDVAVGVGDEIAVLSADGGSAGDPARTIHLDLLDPGGARVRATSWATGHDLTLDLGGALAASSSGGYVAQLCRRLDRALGPTIDQGSQTIALYGVRADGQPAWHSTYGGLRDETASALSIAGDGGVLVAARTASVTLSQDAWFLRLDSCGRIGSACDAEFQRAESGFESEVTTFGAGERFDDYDLSTAFEVPGAVARSETAAIDTTLTGVDVTRQCSGSSKDDVAPPNGTYFTLDVLVVGDGTVEEDAGAGQAPSFSCTSACTIQLPAGTDFLLRAVPGPASELPSWSGAECPGSGVAACSVLMDSDRTVVVTFPPQGGGGGYGGLFDLTVILEGAGDGRVFVNPPGMTCFDTCTIPDLAAAGDEVEIRAIPAPGSTFGGFTGVDSSDGVFGYVLFDAGDRTVRVRFD
ncbi:MAG: hypothetical protein AAGB93_20595 [Planctomycetota bacterium]